MKPEVFCDIFGEIDESYVEEARVGRKKRFGWAKLLTSAACLVLATIAGALLWLPDRSGLPTVDPTAPTAPPEENALRFNMLQLETQYTVLYDPLDSTLNWALPDVSAEEFEDTTGKDFETFRDQIGEPWVFQRCWAPNQLSSVYPTSTFTFSYQCEALGEASVGVSVCDPGLTDPPQPFDCDDPFVSTVNGVKIMLYHLRFQDGVQIDQAYFRKDGLSYCVAMDTNDLNQWEKFLSYLTEA